MLHVFQKVKSIHEISKDSQNSLLFYILKMVTIKEIREIFREILQEHETKQEGMFIKHEKLVLERISGQQALLKQRLNKLRDTLTSVKTDVEELKESLSFT